MCWWKVLSLVSVIGCLSVVAAENKQASATEPRIINGQDLKLFINPFSFLYERKTTAKPRTTIVVKPYEYQYYPNYQQYPYYPNVYYPPQQATYPPSYPASYPTQPPALPSGPTIRPTPPPLYPTQRPVYPTQNQVYPPQGQVYPTQSPVYPNPAPVYPGPTQTIYSQHVPMFPYFPDLLPKPPFSLFPHWMFQQQQQQPQQNQPPYVVVIQPPYNPTHPNYQRIPDNPNIPYVPNPPENVTTPPPVTINGNTSIGRTNAHVKGYEGSYNNDKKSFRYRPRNSHRHNARMSQDYPAYDDVADDEPQPHDYEGEMDGRNLNLDSVSITAESGEDTDTIAVDTKDVKLPFGIQLGSRSVAGEKLRGQEALIYLKNFKTGRQLNVADNTSKID